MVRYGNGRITPAPSLPCLSEESARQYPSYSTATLPGNNKIRVQQGAGAGRRASAAYTVDGGAMSHENRASGLRGVNIDRGRITYTAADLDGTDGGQNDAAQVAVDNRPKGQTTPKV